MNPNERESEEIARIAKIAGIAKIENRKQNDSGGFHSVDGPARFPITAITRSRAITAIADATKSFSLSHRLFNPALLVAALLPVASVVVFLHEAISIAPALLYAGSGPDSH